MTIIEQLVEEFKQQNPTATAEDIKQYIQSLEQHTKVIKEDEWAVNSDQEYSSGEEAVNNTSTNSSTGTTIPTVVSE